MLGRISHPGILLDNVRDLSLSVMASSLVIPLLLSWPAAIMTGLLIGVYYGWRIEKQIHELRTLGGRIMKGKSWDYLILS